MKNKFTALMGIVSMFIVATGHTQVSPTVPVVSAPTNSKIEGTPYLDETFVEGVIALGNKVHAVPVRYNIFQDLMEYKQNGQSLLLDPTTAIKKVRFGVNTFVVQKFEFKGKTKYGFLALLDSGKLMLFSKKVVTYLEARKGGALDGTDLPARYNRSPDVFYYKIGDGELHEVESIKSMIASFPGKQEELTLFAKKEKVSPRKEKTLVQFVQYYNSL
jgi:hypothetical protein